MKKIDYYAVQNPWRMPKWLGAALGGIFGVIVIGSMVTIVQLTRSPTPPPITAVAAAPALQAPATAPVAAASATAADPAKATTAPAAVASADDAALAKKHASKKHAAKSKKGKMLASAKHTPATSSLGAAQRQTILAKHDTKSKRSDKDALDKLLGL